MFCRDWVAIDFTRIIESYYISNHTVAPVPVTYIWRISVAKQQESYEIDNITKKRTEINLSAYDMRMVFFWFVFVVMLINGLRNNMYIIISIDSRANARPPSVLYASALLHGELFNQRSPT